MAGKIVADTLEHSTAGSVTTDFVVNGSAKVWVQFAGNAGTIASSDSLNVASLTDEGTGRYQVNLSSSMNNSDHAVHAAVGQSATSIGDYIGNIANIATGSFDIGQNTRGGSAADSALNTASTFGDLA